MDMDMSVRVLKAAKCSAIAGMPVQDALLKHCRSEGLCMDRHEDYAPWILLRRTATGRAGANCDIPVLAAGLCADGMGSWFDRAITEAGEIGEILM